MKRFTTWLKQQWAEYCEIQSGPIVITTAGIFGPIPPEWYDKKDN